MRNATILVLTIRGLATEVVKNIVLAGVGKLIMADNEDVKEEDLGAGFFFRDGDVGRKVCFSTLSEFSHRPPRCVPVSGLLTFPCQRVDAARTRVESLNPLVAIEAVSFYDDESLVKLIETVDLVCVTEETRDNIVSSTP